MSISNVRMWVAVVVGVFTIAGYLAGFFRWLRIKKLFSLVTKKFSRASIVVVYPNALFHEMIAWWHMGTRVDKPIMQVVGDFLVTNISKRRVLLTGAILKGCKVRGTVDVKELNSQFYSHDYQIPLGCTTKVRILFFLEPPIKQEGETLVDDVAILDQFGKKHWIKKVEFKCV